MPSRTYSLGDGKAFLSGGVWYINDASVPKSVALTCRATVTNNQGQSASSGDVSVTLLDLENMIGSIISAGDILGGTPKDVAPGGGISTIYDYTILDANNVDVTDATSNTVDNVTPKITIDSDVDLTGYKVQFIGE